jgi:23S rRNA (cytidine1920-2'-O)/16S rRNA (cytidine1409-2'-O)-methyltransferase
MSKERIDKLLVDKGLFPTREKAQRAIMAGQVFVKTNRIDKASTSFPPDTEIEVHGIEKYVGRGGLKLEGALETFSINPSGLRCIDIGASTGGFTDCLLQKGASHVVALDVGHGQLDWKIRSDSRVTVIEKCNARYLTEKDFPEKFDAVVTDVSFISLKLILPPALSILKPGGWIVALIKPQFEVGKKEIGKGGIVRDAELQQKVVDDLLDWIKSLPAETLGVAPSPITGTDGNREFLWYLKSK